MKRTLFALLLLAGLAQSYELPPTTLKGSGDSTDVVTFGYRFPYFAVEHVGVVGSVGMLSVPGGGTGGSYYTAGGVLFGNGASAVASDATKLFWDNSGKYLGINQPVPVSPLHVKSKADGWDDGVSLESASGGTRWNILADGQSLYFREATSPAAPLMLHENGFVSIGQFTEPTQSLDAVGTARLRGLTTAGPVQTDANGVLSSSATLPVANGGTAIASYTAGDTIYATGTTTLAKLAKGTANYLFGMNSGATAPEYKSILGINGQTTVTHGTAQITIGTAQSIATTDNVVFGTLGFGQTPSSGSGITSNAITFGNYEEITIVSPITNVRASDPNITLKFTRVGKAVNWLISSQLSTIGVENKPNATDPALTIALPTNFRPAVSSPEMPALFYQNGTDGQWGMMEISSAGVITFRLAGFVAWGTGTGIRIYRGGGAYTVQ